MRIHRGSASKVRKMTKRRRAPRRVPAAAFLTVPLVLGVCLAVVAWSVFGPNQADKDHNAVDSTNVAADSRPQIFPTPDESVEPRDSEVPGDLAQARQKLEKDAAKRAEALQKAAEEAAFTLNGKGAISFRVASLNALGHSHTRPGGNRQGWSPATKRTRVAAQAVKAAGASVVGFQEFEPLQKSVFRRHSPGWDVYPGGRWPDAMAWNTGVWQVQETRMIRIPYFGGRLKPMPYVKLKHRDSGRSVWFGSFHNPADVRGNAAGHRARAIGRQAGLARALMSNGDPVIFTGDFNDRARAFCGLTTQAPLRSASGGSVGSPCRPPGRMSVDWIFGSVDFAFSGYNLTRGYGLARATDHPMVVATASLS